jgi:hypothetical protein
VVEQSVPQRIECYVAGLADELPDELAESLKFITFV